MRKYSKYNSPGLKSPSFAVLLLMWLILTVNGCAVSVNKHHPALQLTPDVTPAKVYFIRPTPVKHKGIADNEITVDYAGQELLSITEGSYTLVEVNPGKGEITTHSKTMFTNRIAPITVSRNRLYTFVSGGTYFIYLKRDNQEFRGIFYDPEPVDLATAKLLTDDLSASGHLARREPIDRIQSIPPVPPTGPLEPVTPEQLYRSKSPYLLKKPIKQ